MSNVVTAIRKEVVIVAGVLVAVLDFVLTHGNVLSSIIPLVVSVLTRSQVSPLAKLEELLALVSQLKAAK